jgi:hypothetical protein
MHQIHPIYDLRITRNGFRLRNVPEPLLHLQPDFMFLLPSGTQDPPGRLNGGRVVEDPREEDVTEGDYGSVVVCCYIYVN